MIPFLIQETTFGQLVRFLSRNKYFKYPEEDPNFKIPWEAVDVAEKEEKLEQNALPSAHGSDSSTPIPSPSAVEKQDPIRSEAGLTTIPTAASSARRDFNLVTTRTRTREQTTQYSAERFEVEQEEAIDRTRSSVIQPQTTADGITLVDWYTTDDPNNPQNWNSWTKAWVSFHIFAYTFVVYCASAIYTPAEPQVMEKFGVGQSKASLGLSMYVIGYGLGPLVSLDKNPFKLSLTSLDLLSSLRSPSARPQHPLCCYLRSVRDPRGTNRSSQQLRHSPGPPFPYRFLRLSMLSHRRSNHGRHVRPAQTAIRPHRMGRRQLLRPSPRPPPLRIRRYRQRLALGTMGSPLDVRSHLARHVLLHARNLRLQHPPAPRPTLAQTHRQPQFEIPIRD